MVLVLNVVIAQDFCFCVNPLSAIENLKIRTAGKWSLQFLETEFLVVGDYVLLNPVLKNFILLHTFIDRLLRLLRGVLVVHYSGDHTVEIKAAIRWGTVLCSTCGAKSPRLPQRADVRGFFSIEYFSALALYKDSHNPVGSPKAFDKTPYRKAIIVR